MRQILLKKVNTYAFDKVTRQLDFEMDPADFKPSTMEWETLDYAAQIRVILRRPLDPQRGISIEEQERSLRMLNALKGKTEGDTFLIEDEADYLHLREKVEKFPWAYVSEFFQQFVDDIRQAKAISAERLKEQTRDEVKAELQNGHSKKSKSLRALEPVT